MVDASISEISPPVRELAKPPCSMCTHSQDSELLGLNGIITSGDPPIPATNSQYSSDCQCSIPGDRPRVKGFIFSAHIPCRIAYHNLVIYCAFLNCPLVGAEARLLILRHFTPSVTGRYSDRFCPLLFPVGSDGT